LGALLFPSLEEGTYQGDFQKEDLHRKQGLSIQSRVDLQRLDAERRHQTFAPDAKFQSIRFLIDIGA
jgi:hypothetical protein